MKKILCALFMGLSMSACMKEEAVLAKNYKLSGTDNDVSITLGFDIEKGRYHGGVVNRFFGNYKVEGDKMTISPGGATMMMGPPQAMDAERDFLATLPTVVSYELDGKNLTLTTTNGQELIFIEAEEVE